MNLYVIRHGQTNINVQNKINGHNDIGLNDEGIRQAEEAATQIKKIKIDLIISSPLERTKQTAKIVNKNNVAIIYDIKLIERDSNSLQYQPVSILDKKIWYSLDSDIVYKDSESFGSVFKRVESLLKEIKKNYNYKNILLVTHGDVCRAIKFYFENKQQIDEFEQHNCEIIKYTL